MDVAELSLKVDSSDAERSKRSLDNLSSSARKAETATERFVRQTEQMGKTMQSVGRRMSLFITAPMAAASLASIKLAIDAEETANKFNVVFRGSVQAARSELDKLTKTIPLTRSQMEGMAAGIQDMLVPMGVARSQAAGMSVDMVKLAGDLASFNNVGTDQVLMAIQSALAGSSEPMRRFGVDTRETALQQIALAEGLIGAGQEMTTTARAQAVLIAVTKDSTDAMGDAARTVDSTANQMRFLQRDIRQLSEDIGNDLIPVFRDVLQDVRAAVTVFAELDAETRQTIIRVSAIAAATGPLLLVFGSLTTMLSRLIGFVVQYRAALVALGGPTTIAVAGVGALIIAYSRLSNRINEVRESMIRLNSQGIRDTELSMSVLTNKIGAQSAELAQLEENISGARGSSAAFGAMQNRMKLLRQEIDENIEELETYAKILKTHRAAQDEASTATGEATVLMDAHVKAMLAARQETQETVQSVDDHIAALEQQITALGMTERAAVIYMSVMDAINSGALPEQVARIAELTAKMYDLELAQRAATGTTSEAGEEIVRTGAAMRDLTTDVDLQRNMVENLQREWANLIQTFITGESDIGDFFDTFAKGIARMFSEAASKDITSAIFGGGGAGVSGGSATAGAMSMLNMIPGGSSFLSNSGFGGAELMGPTQNGSKLVQGFDPMRAGMTMAAGFSGSFAGDELGQALFGKQAESNIGAAAGSAIGTALGGPVGAFLGGLAGGALDVAFGGDGRQRGMAGFLAANTPGAPAGSQFQVDPFASGFAPTGFADGPVSRKDAERLIERFRFLSDTVTEAAREVGATIDMSRATLGGFGLDGTGPGTFFGMSDITTEAQLQAQEQAFLQQVVGHFEGLAPDTMAQLMGASSAQEMVDILGELRDTEENLSEDISRLAASLGPAFDSIFGTSIVSGNEGSGQSRGGGGGGSASDMLAAHQAAGTEPSVGSNAYFLQRARDRGHTAEGSTAARQLFGEESYLASLRLRGDDLVSLRDAYLAGDQGFIDSFFADTPSLRAALTDIFDPQIEFGSLPSHRNGLDYVPHDNYTANLHQGERVLTKSQAERADQDSGMDREILMQINTNMAIMVSTLKKFDKKGIAER